MQLFYSKFYTIIFIILLLSGCNHKQRKQVIKKGNPNTKMITLVTFELSVEGIECELCAHSALTILQSIKGIQNPYFAGAYEQGILKYQWNKDKTPPLATIIHALGTEGFTFISLQGSFSGRFTENEEKKYVFVLDDGLPIHVANTLQKTTTMDDATWQSIEKNTPCTIQATIWFDATSKHYWLAKK